MVKFSTIEMAESIMHNVLYNYANKGIDRVIDYKDSDLIKKFQHDCANHAVHLIMSHKLDVATATKTMCIVNACSNNSVTNCGDQHEFVTYLAEARRVSVNDADFIVDQGTELCNNK